MVSVKYESITHLELECTCIGISMWKWEALMYKARKANGSKIRGLIKKHLPEVYEALALEYPNPYEHQCKKTSTHLIYVHSGIEYFIKILD
jgi:hypothetical protein